MSDHIDSGSSDLVKGCQLFTKSKDTFPVILVTVLSILILFNGVSYDPAPAATPTPTVIATATATPTATPTPWPTSIYTFPVPLPVIWSLMDAIPTPLYYPCEATERTTCITEHTPLFDAITMTVFGEGGNVNLQVAVDMMQVLDNAMRNAWDCWQYTSCTDSWDKINPLHTPYKDADTGQRVRLAAFLMSSPYTVHARTWPAWNVWGSPFTSASVKEIPYEAKAYATIREGLILWITTVDSSPAIKDPYYLHHWYVPHTILKEDTDIMYFYGGPGDMKPSDMSKVRFTYQFYVQDKEYNIYYSVP